MKLIYTKCFLNRSWFCLIDCKNDAKLYVMKTKLLNNCWNVNWIKNCWNYWEFFTFDKFDEFFKLVALKLSK